jgi:uncharacterized protein
MDIRLRDLARGPRDYSGDDAAALADLDEPDLCVCGPVRYAVSAVLVSGQLVVRGRASVEMEFACVRCASPFRRRVEEPALEIVREIAVEEEGCPAADLQVVDLTPDLREAMLLAFPSYPLCDAACKGLCPQCGCNRNRETCACRPPAGTHWDGLSGLSVS